MENRTRQQTANRVQKHRERAMLSGLKRVEVKVPESDEDLIRSIAKNLRDDEELAKNLREELAKLLPATSSQSTLEFFQNSPLATLAQEVSFDRDQDSGTPLIF